MSKFRHCAYVGVAMLAASGAASATTIIATLNSMTPQQSVRVTLPSGATNTSAGRFNFTRTGGTHPVNPLPDSPVSRFWAFCVELGQTINLGESVTYDVLPLAAGGNVTGGIGATKADEILELLGAVYPDFTQVLANDQYAALQVSIWEITRENRATYGYDVFTGDVKFSNTPASILNTANGWLAQIDGLGPRAPRIRALVSERRQDMLVQFPVPEPGVLALTLLGLGVVAGARRRKP